jgi:hypothetical protein
MEIIDSCPVLFDPGASEAGKARWTPKPGRISRIEDWSPMSDGELASNAKEA